MVQEASLDTLALAGAIAATLFAALTYMLGRRSRAAPALLWWATAFGVEALRLATISVTWHSSNGRLEVIANAGHAFVAIPILVGTLVWLGRPVRGQALWGFTGLVAATLLIGLLDARAIGPAASLLGAFGATFLAASVWLFWQNHRAGGGRSSDLVAAAALALLAIHLIQRTFADLGFAAGSSMHGMDEWDALVHLGLSLLTMASLVVAAQHRALYAGRVAQERLAASEQRFRDYAETSADWFWETDMEQRFTSYVESGEAVATSNITIGLTRGEIHRRINAEPNLAPIVAEFMAKGEAFRNLECRFEDSKRGTRWVHISGKPVCDASG